jgi:hypothetical protein
MRGTFKEKGGCMNRVAVALAVAFLVITPAVAETGSRWGTSDEIIYPILAPDLDLASSDGTYGTFLTGRFSTNGLSGFLHGLRLPQGAVITRMEADLCDNHNPGQMRASIVRVFLPAGGGIAIAPEIFTGTTFSDGGACGTYQTIVTNSEPVDNQTYAYYVSTFNEGNLTNSTRVTMIRVYYKLQVSPAPLTATFDDVPTSHPFHRFIEALAAAGITAGCNASPPLFCPDQPVTRGQMAVFLSAALGLHWP